MAKYYERLLTTDVFKQPKVVTDKEAISVLLIRLILLEPGTFSTRPEMGVGLVSKFRYMDESNLSELKKEIRNQITKYLPMFQAVDVGLSMDQDKQLTIEIQVDDTLYKYETAKQEGNTITLVDMLNNNI